MVAWVSGPDPSGVDPATTEPRATVPFGHDCLAPTVTAPDGTSRLCPRFGRVPVLSRPRDPNRCAHHLARILLAVDRLDEARHRLDPRRWDLLYAPTYRILTKDILADFPAGMHVAARALAATMPALPELE